MATVMEMPKLSDTMKQGVVSHWLKKEGEKMVAGLPVIEIETDKATMEFESPSSGLLLKILVHDGETCELQAPIAVIGKEGENWQEVLDKHLAKKQNKAAPKPISSSKDPVIQAPVIQASPLQAPVKETPVPLDTRLRVSPLAKKQAEAKGLDLRSVTGSGPHGRIIARDIQIEHVSLPIEELGSTLKIPLTSMRKTIAHRLTESVTTAPHFYLKTSVNMETLLNWRESFLKQSEVRFSINDLFLFLTSRALLRHPLINSSWQGDHIAQYNFVNMNFAVALPQGLMTPLIPNCHQLNLVSLAAYTKNLIEKARSGKLQSSEYQSGTFTISNLGPAGIEEFSAIINPPQAAILAVGSTLPQPYLLGKDIITQRITKLTLSCDHRVIDGAQGAHFLKTLKSYLENPMEALFF